MKLYKRLKTCKPWAISGAVFGADLWKRHWLHGGDWFYFTWNGEPVETRLGNTVTTIEEARWYSDVYLIENNPRWIFQQIAIPWGLE